jgi:hypothetical protein
MRRERMIISGLDSPSEGAGPTIMRQRRFEFGLPFGERRRIVKVLDLLAAVWLNHDQFEANAGWSGTSFAPDESALPFVKPDHAAADINPRGSLSLA